MDHRGGLQVFRLLLVAWLTVGPALAHVRHPLPVMWMMPVSSGSGMENQTAGVVAAVRLALKDLEKQPPPLGNYDIQLQLLDTECDPAKALKVLFDTMWAGPRYLLVFGGVCPSVTALIARSLPALSLVQVSFAASAPSLSNRRLYGNLFSTVPSDRALNQAAVKLLQRYRWNRVGVVTQEGPRLSEMNKDLIRQLQKADVELVVTEGFSEDVCSCLKSLKERDVRIIVAQFQDDYASEVFCCAFRLNLFGARYQWIVAGPGAAGWRLGWRPSACKASSLLKAADGAFRLQIRQLSSTTAAGVSGRTPQGYQDSYLRQLTQEGSEVGPQHAFAYDAVWVAARALSQVMEAVKHRQKYSTQRNVRVSEEEELKMLLEAMKKTQFEGVTGPVFFRNGERMSLIELIQFQGSSSVLVGEFNTSTQQFRLINHLLKFQGPGPARDQTLIRLQHHHVSLLLYVVVASAAGATIFITLTVLCFVVFNHKHWTLTSGSTSQDLLLLLGVLLSSCSVLLSGLDGASLSDWTFEIFCSVRLWTLSVGHSVGFAVLFTKTWRIYSLCTIKQKPTRLQRTGRILLWFFLLDVLVLTSWQILDPLRRVEFRHSPESDAADQDVVVQPYSDHCSSINMDLWLTAVYGYRAPLLGLGCFLAWNIRMADVGPLPITSKLLSVSMFAVMVFSVSGVSGSLLTSQNPPVQFCLSSILILSCCIFILSSLFGPQMFYMLWRSNELQRQFEMDNEASDVKQKDELRRLNEQLKSQSEQLDVQIETIRMELSGTTEEEISQHVTGEKHTEVHSLTHEAQICAHNRNSTPDSINSPEHVRRRLSIQLPILHHSYLPIIGGIRSSRSSLCGNQEVFIRRDDS
ncbi:gamma-aminobutyric acid type B receptor subunit 2-like [Xenentodon cancila]